jgi:hypothetical protein
MSYPRVTIRLFICYLLGPTFLCAVLLAWFLIFSGPQTKFEMFSWPLKKKRGLDLGSCMPFCIKPLGAPTPTGLKSMIHLWQDQPKFLSRGSLSMRRHRVCGLVEPLWRPACRTWVSQSIRLFILFMLPNTIVYAGSRSVRRGPVDSLQC